MPGQKIGQLIGIVRQAGSLQYLDAPVDAVDINDRVSRCFALNLEGVKSGKFQVRAEIAPDIGVYDGPCQR